jgi:hypothetical protein
MAETVSRIYSNFRGVDFRGEEINLVRSPDALNMWKDYKETESIRTRPGLELKHSGSSIHGIWEFNGMLYVHSGTNILTPMPNGVLTGLVYSGVEDAPSQTFVYDNKLYFKDGKNYLQFNGSTFKAVEGYIPTTTIARKPMGGGTKYEDVNMLSDYRINTFLATGADFDYYLDVVNISSDFVPEVTIDNLAFYYEVTCSYAEGDVDKVNPIFTKTETELTLDYETIVEMMSKGSGETTTRESVYCYDEENSLYCCIAYKDTVVPPEEYDVDYAEGKISFKHTPPNAPLTDGQDNVKIKFKKAIPEYRNCILKSTLLQVFDNRVFVSGNPDYPNWIWHCSLNDPSYFSDLDYYQEGMDKAAVKGMVAGNNALWVFREPSDANTTVFYHTPTIDEEYGKIYPNSHSTISTGCIGKAINFNDDIVFFSERGMEGISGDITTEQVVAHRSSLVDRKMTAEADYKNMTLAEWEGYLLVIIGNKVYLADSRATFQNENHIEYEWFYWELSKNITCSCVIDGVLYLGADDGVYVLTNTTANVPSYWTTPKDKFKNPHKLKTTNKRGCVAEATGDITLSAKLEDTDFEPIGTYNNVTDYFVSRIKRKKFKDIQLKFSSDSRFSLETVTLEAFIGGYIKR